MAVLDSAIVGGIIGGAAAGVMVYMQARQRRKLAEYLRSGVEAERLRPMIDRLYPFKGKLGLYQILPLSTRFVALGAIGQQSAVREEVAALPKDARLTCRVQVVGMGLLVQRVLGDPDPTLHSDLEALSAEIERDGGKLLALVKRLARILVAASRAVDGTPMDDETRRLIASQMRSHPHAKVVWLMAQMYDRIARGDVAGLAAMNIEIEHEWPKSAYARRAETLLAQAASASRPQPTTGDHA